MTKQEAEKGARIIADEGGYARVHKSNDAFDYGGYIVQGERENYFHLWEITNPLDFEYAYDEHSDADSSL